MKEKAEVKVGDKIHIYHMFGESEYSGTEGIVTYVDDINQIHGTWGDCALLFHDDWEVVEEA